MHAFWNCESLNSISLPNSLTTIDREVFKNCKSLESVDIPNSIMTLGVGAFGGVV